MSNHLILRPREGYRGSYEMQDTRAAPRREGFVQLRRPHRRSHAAASFPVQCSSRELAFFHERHYHDQNQDSISSSFDHPRRNHRARLHA